MTGPDYQTLIDSQIHSFIRATDSCYPTETSSLDIAGQRRVYDIMCAHFRQPYPEGIRAQDETIAGVRCRRYSGSAPSVLYFHGGGFVVGGLHSHDDVCAEIAAATGLEVISVDYRLSPEHDHPAAFEDACAVALALRGPLLLVGDSAGANLAAAAAHALRGKAEILGQVLIYPGLGGDRSRGSYQTHAFAPMLTLADVEFYASIRGPETRGDASLAPLQDSDFSGLPPTYAVAAECDPLADDALAYGAAIVAAGGQASAQTEAGLVHGYLRARHMSDRAAASFARICATLSAFARSEWPFKETQ